MLADDYFAGAGGWDLGAHALGIRTRGIEIMPAARATRAANGLETIHDDVWTYVPDGHATGQIASPPCPTFSQAGGGSGRRNLHLVLEAIRTGAWRDIGQLHDMAERLGGDDGWLTALVLTPLHFAVVGGYEWLAWEQVPSVLPIWQACAGVLTEEGFDVWTGYVHAEQYGVAQTRKRAKLLASKHHRMHKPVPTHSKYHQRDPERLDPGVAKWVSMAEALGWGARDLVGFPRRADAVDVETLEGDVVATAAEVVTIDGVEYRARDLRSGDEPSLTVTEKARSWHRYMLGAGLSGAGAPRPTDHPAPTISGAGNATWTDNPDAWYGAGSPTQRREEIPDDALLCPTNLRPNAALRRLDQPAPTMAFGHEQPRWVTPEELAEYRASVAEEVGPRVNNQSGTEFDLAWPADRPAPTVAGRDLVTMPGANANRFNGSTKSRNDGVRVTIAEAGVLQSFPADYHWQGGKSDQFLQAGNAVPPLLARASLAVAAGLDAAPEHEPDLFDLL